MTNVSNFKPWTPGGLLVIGQEQDFVGGGFDESQSISGYITQFGIWDRKEIMLPDLLAISITWIYVLTNTIMYEIWIWQGNLSLLTDEEIR